MRAFCQEDVHPKDIVTVHRGVRLTRYSLGAVEISHSSEQQRIYLSYKTEDKKSEAKCQTRIRVQGSKLRSKQGSAPSQKVYQNQRSGNKPV